MTDLHDLLERSVDAPDPADVTADLRRGRRALRRRNRQTWVTGAFGLAAVAVGATAIGQPSGPRPSELGPAADASTAVPSSSAGPAADARLTSPGDVVGPLTVRPIGPQENRYYAGHVHTGTGDLPFARLQIVDERPGAGARTVSYRGRTVYQDTDVKGSTVLMVQDPHALWLRLTTPAAMGWSLDEQLRFLAGSGTVVPEPGT